MSSGIVATDPTGQVSTSIDELVDRIRGHIECGVKAAEKADEHFKAAALLIKQLKEAEPTNWQALVRDRCGLGRSRAYELLRIADGRDTVGETREKTNARSRRHHEKVKSSVANGQRQAKDKTKTEPKFPPNEEPPEASGEERKAQNDALYGDSEKQHVDGNDQYGEDDRDDQHGADRDQQPTEGQRATESPTTKTQTETTSAEGTLEDAEAELKRLKDLKAKLKDGETENKVDARASMWALTEFKAACSKLLPGMNSDDLQKAIDFLRRGGRGAGERIDARFEHRSIRSEDRQGRGHGAQTQARGQASAA
jgi:hypothetical protein